MSEPCVASREDFVGACQPSEKHVVHKRLIASRAVSHKIQIEATMQSPNHTT
jgi:hypothetical protein